MPNNHCFTSASFAYLDRVRVLAETLKKHQPDWTFWLCLCDEEPEGYTFDIENESIDHVVRLTELNIPDLTQWTFCHDVIELCTAVKGAMLCHLFQLGAEKVIYLDPDVAVFASLDPIVKILDEHSIVLTPHQLEPDSELPAIMDNEIGSLKHGIFNLGFIAVANNDTGRRFADWWNMRLMRFCWDDIPSGLFTDQRWCDLVPVFFPDTHILRDPGYNVASWNLSKRPITTDREGCIWAANKILRFFHFTKVGSVGRIMLERYSNGHLEMLELIHWYLQRLKANHSPELPKNWWAFAKYDDDTPIPKSHRISYRKRPELMARFTDPFATGVHSLEAHLSDQEK